MTGCVAPGSDTGNSANCSPYAYPPGTLTDVGAYSLSDSPYGTYDQGGNVFEWNEQIVSGSLRGVRGGGWINGAIYLAASSPYLVDPSYEDSYIGIRLARPIPEPGTGLLVMAGLAGFAVRRRRPAQAL